jgi:hypothetical protein
MEIGDCRLCLAKGVELQVSHIVPKWTYRRAFDKTRANGSPNPIMMTNEVVIQTSEQRAEPMLCVACEQQLGRDESYIADLAYQTENWAFWTSFRQPRFSESTLRNSACSFVAQTSPFSTAKRSLVLQLRYSGVPT